MNDAQSVAPVVRFGTFEVNLNSHELRKHGMRIRLEEKPFQILELLLERAGHVVTRRALREKLWPDTVVGYEHGLNTAVNKLRDLLGDSARSPRFVETLPRLGYRFIAPVVMPEKAVATEGKRMLLVLPFESLCGDDEQEFFAEGLTEETISQLGQLRRPIQGHEEIHWRNCCGVACRLRARGKRALRWPAHSDKRPVD
jgi:DNA-binding winged helix-turn-helix (wHTH) protein